ncbi:MAG TPA: hypothetical protein VF084_04445 [Nitrososphaeraceae archaeon]
MIFKYKQSIANTIIHVLAKKKANEKITKDELLWRVDKLKHPPDPLTNTKQTINSTHFSSALQLLIQHDLVIKEKDITIQGSLKRKKTIYSLSDLGLFFYKHKYEIKDIEKFVKISQLLSVVALLGSSALEERKIALGEKPQAADQVIPQENILNLAINKRIKAKYGYLTRKEGVSRKDLLEKRYYLTQSNLLRLALTEKEANDYLDFLSDKKILKINPYEGDEKRYQLYNKEIEDFMNEAWVSLFSFLLMRIKTKLHYLVKKLDLIEKKWCITHLGKWSTNNMINHWYSQRSIGDYKKPINYSYLEKSYREEIKQINNLILNKYDKLFSRYGNTFKSLPGMENLIISLVCSKEMIDHVRGENERLIRNK